MSHCGLFIQAKLCHQCHVMFLFRISDSKIYHHASWAAGTHTSWACGTQESGICQIQTGGAVQVSVCTLHWCVAMDGDNVDANDHWSRCQDDARWSEWHREHQKESGHREDDCRGLWHPVGHQSDLRQARWASSASSASLSLWLITFHSLWTVTPRPGSLIQLPSSSERGMLSKVRLGSLTLRKEGERQCFLFTKHFLICTRTSGGKLHLLKVSRTCPHRCLSKYSGVDKLIVYISCLTQCKFLFYSSSNINWHTVTQLLVLCSSYLEMVNNENDLLRWRSGHISLL